MSPLSHFLHIIQFVFKPRPLFNADPNILNANSTVLAWYREIFAVFPYIHLARKNDILQLFNRFIIKYPEKRKISRKYYTPMKVNFRQQSWNTVLGKECCWEKWLVKCCWGNRLVKKSEGAVKPSSAQALLLAPWKQEFTWTSNVMVAIFYT